MKYTRTRKNGICCPRCGCRHIPVVGTYRIGDGVMRRYRECRNCGNRLTTTESIGTRPKDVPDRG
jgi:transcriptional regulator NrdR family protein